MNLEQRHRLFIAKNRIERDFFNQSERSMRTIEIVLANQRVAGV